MEGDNETLGGLLIGSDSLKCNFITKYINTLKKLMTCLTRAFLKTFIN